jgi:hypothetical protein
MSRNFGFPATCRPVGRRTGWSTVRWLAELAAAAACCVGLSSTATASAAGDQVQPFSGHYEGSKKIALVTATAKAEIELRRSADFIRYTMRSTVRWAFLERSFYDCSTIRIDGDRMLPVEYVHVDESDPGLNVLTRFDWKENKATTVLGSALPAAVSDITWPTWDPMSFQVALIWLSQRRRPGDSELHRVIERGTLKEHRVRFSGPVSLARGGRDVPVHEIISRKAKGQVALYLLQEPPRQPFRIAFEDVTIDLTGTSSVATPEPIAEGQLPPCVAGSTR